MKKIIVIALLIMLAGCKKFSEDEANIHMLTVKNRLCRVWCHSVTDVHCDGGDLIIKSNGHFHGICPFSSYVVQNNTWELIENNNKLRLFNTSNNKTYDYTITRLEQYKGTWHLNLKNDSTTFYFQGEEYN